ncbi:MAG: T9SS type A sorting domain-containing protein [Chitinophagales bacterium]
MKILRTYILILFVVSAKCVMAQVTFQKKYYLSDATNGKSAQQTMDGGYIIAGTTELAFGLSWEDICLIRTDEKGCVLWTSVFGGLSGDYTYSVRETSDRGFIVAGMTLSFGEGSWDILLLKTDSFGNILWSKTIGGAGDDRCYAIREVSDGGFILTGSTSSFGAGYYDIYLVRTDGLGNVLWSKTYGGSAGDYAYSIEETIDGGFIMTGEDQSFSIEGNVCLIKTDITGNVEWSKVYGGSNGDWGTSVMQALDGGYIIAGGTSSFSAYPKSDYYIIKTDQIGNLIWSGMYGGSNYDNATSICQTIDGGYLISGNTVLEEDGVYHCSIIKIDAFGNLLFSNTFGRIGYDYGDYYLQRTYDGGYIVVGTTVNYPESDRAIYLVKTDALANTGCDDNAVVHHMDIPDTQVNTPMTEVNQVESIVSSAELLVKSTTSNTSTVCYNENDTHYSLFVYPNPCIDQVLISGTGADGVLSIYTITGQLVYELPTNSFETILNTASLTPGVYLIRYNNGSIEKYVKLIKN